jgi:hypothetical protein
MKLSKYIHLFVYQNHNDCRIIWFWRHILRKLVRELNLNCAVTVLKVYVTDDALIETETFMAY